MTPDSKDKPGAAQLAAGIRQQVDEGTRERLLAMPLPPHTACDNPEACGGDDLCPPCQDLEEWRALQRERMLARERLAPLLRDLLALCDLRGVDDLLDAIEPLIARRIKEDPSGELAEAVRAAMRPTLVDLVREIRGALA